MECVKCSRAGKSGGWKNIAGTDKEEEKKLAGPLPKKVCGRRRYQMIENFMINGLYADMKRKVEKRVVWRMLSLQ